MTEGRTLFQLAFTALGAWLIHLLSPILTPFLVGGLLAYLGNPAVARLARWRFPRPLAVALVFLLFVLALIGLLLFLIPALQGQIVAFTAKVPVYLDWLQNTGLPQLQNRLGLELPLDMASLRQAVLDHWREVGDWARAFVVYLTKSGWSVVGWAVNLLLIPVITFYLLLDWDQLLARALALAPPRRQAQLAQLARESDEVLGSFLRGQMSVMIALAFVYSAGLSLVGLDLALPIGVFAGLVSFVPYLGFVSGLLSAAVAAYLQFHDAWTLAGVAAVFVTGQLLESLLLTPRLVGEKIGLHPVAVIFAVMAGGQLFGFTGVLLALPAAAVLKVWVRHLRDFYTRELAAPAGKKRRTPKSASP
jgi:predicted PurR-regulated permease PerM